MIIRNIFIVIFSFLSGCASQVPILIKSNPEPNLAYQQVKNNIDLYQAKPVRWGGQIISVENKENSSWIEVLLKPLDTFGEPTETKDYQGRFIARVDGFVDPEYYSKGRSLTVYGKIETTIIRQIDEHPYEYPLVYAEEHYLWPKYRAAHHYPHYPYPYGYYRYRYGFPYYYHPFYRFRYRHFYPY